MFSDAHRHSVIWHRILICIDQIAVHEQNAGRPADKAEAIGPFKGTYGGVAFLK
jgi:hypothetical protein